MTDQEITSHIVALEQEKQELITDYVEKLPELKWPKIEADSITLAIQFLKSSIDPQFQWIVISRNTRLRIRKYLPWEHQKIIEIIFYK